MGLGIKLAYGAVNITKWADLPIAGISTDTNGNWDYDQTKANDFVLKDRIFFASSSARLYINATISGDWNNLCGMIFCLDTQKSVVFNPGHIFLALDSDQIAQGFTGFFQLQNKASLEINSDLTITATSMSNFDQGLFNIKDATLHFINSDLSIDLSNNQRRAILFDLSQNANVTINSSGNSIQQKVLLKGGIKLANQAKFELNLSNKQSNFEGFIELQDNSNFLLKLTDSQATLTGYTDNLNGIGQANFDLTRSRLDAQITGRQTDLNLSSSSIWNMLHSSEIRNLTLQNSQVDFMQDAQDRFNQPQKTLQANSLNGNGIFRFYADLDQRQIDTLILENAEGHHQIRISYNLKTFTQALAQTIDEQSNMVIANITNASQATFEANKSEIGLIAYQTHLKKITQNAQQTQWVISSIVPSGYSTLSKVLSTALNTPYRLFDLSNSILALRLGDLRNYPKDYGLYFRITTGLNQLKETPNTLAIQESWIQLAGGFDLNQNYRQRTDFFGMGLDTILLYSKHSVFTLRSQAYGINLYYTSIFDHGFYLDLILKYSFSPSSFQSSQNLGFQTHLFHLGFEIGKKIAMQNHKNFFYIEPQSKLTSGVILPLSFELNEAEQIKGKLQTQIPLIARASLYLGYEWNTDLNGDFKIGSFVEYSLKNGGKILLSDPRSSIEREFKSDFDVGITAIGSIEFQKLWRFYLGLDSSFLGSYTTNITFNAGVRWSFGDRYIPPPPLEQPKALDHLKIRYRPSPPQRTIPMLKKEGIDQMKHYDEKIVKTQQNGNKNRLYPNPSIKNPPVKLQGQKEYNRAIKRDRFSSKKDGDE